MVLRSEIRGDGGDIYVRARGLVLLGVCFYFILDDMIGSFRKGFRFGVRGFLLGWFFWVDATGLWVVGHAVGGWGEM